MKTTSTYLLVTIAVTAISLRTGLTQQSTNRSQQMVEKLAGQKTASPITGGFVARGSKNRSLNGESTPEKQVKTRTVYISRGAKAEKAFFGNPTTKVTEVKAPSYNPNQDAKGDLGVQAGTDAYKVEYKVDPTSELKGEVFFNKGNAEIKSGTGSTRYLVDLAAALSNPRLQRMKFMIEGHASADGNAVTNKSLSQKRADKIQEMLVEYGASRDQIYAIGFGEDEAQHTESSDESLLQKDRRVLIYKLEE